MSDTERTGEPNTPYMGMPATGSRGRKHKPDSPEAEFARERVLRFAADEAEREKALINDKAVTR